MSKQAIVIMKFDHKTIDEKLLEMQFFRNNVK